jgi:hypothetical protein
MKQKYLISTIFIGALLPIQVLHAGTILSDHKYAWSNNVGYINFEHLEVTNTALTGYAWAANAGWIKFNPAQGGVTNDGNGNLSGYAWGANLGWIDFDGTSINPETGKFSGTASGSRVGTITFDCPSYCDVRTDWRKSTSVASSGGVSGGFGNNSLPGLGASLLGEANVHFLETGVNKHSTETPFGNVIVEFFNTNKITPKTTLEYLNTANSRLIPTGFTVVSGAFYNIEAKDADGNLVHTFNPPIRITLPVPPNLFGAKNVAVYWFNENSKKWTLIPGAIFFKDKVIFETGHLSYFAIFEETVQATLPQNNIEEITIPQLGGVGGGVVAVGTKDEPKVQVGETIEQPIASEESVPTKIKRVLAPAVRATKDAYRTPEVYGVLLLVLPLIVYLLLWRKKR